jgi:hypothetical protein
MGEANGMRLTVHDDEDEPAGEPATSDAIRAAFYAPELWYGTEIGLHAPTGEVLVAAAATEVCMTRASSICSSRMRVGCERSAVR